MKFKIKYNSIVEVFSLSVFILPLFENESMNSMDEEDLHYLTQIITDEQKNISWNMIKDESVRTTIIQKDTAFMVENISSSMKK